MLREKVIPTNQADAFLTEVMQGGGQESMDQAGDLLPDRLKGVLADLLAQGTCQSWYNFATFLGGAGLTAASVAALDQAVAQAPDAIACQKPYADKIGILDRLGLSFAAAADRRTLRRLQNLPPLSETLPDVGDGDHHVVSVYTDPDAYWALVAGADHSPLLADPLRDPFFAKSLFVKPILPDYLGGVQDLSFFITDRQGQPLIQVECDVAGRRYLGCREAGICLTPLVAPSPERDMAEKLALDQLILVSDWCGAGSLMLDVSAERTESKVVSDWLMQTRHAVADILSAWIDLSQSPEQIEAGYRDAHRQSVRWGRKNMTVTAWADLSADAQAPMLSLYTQLYRAANREPGLEEANLGRLLADGTVQMYVGYYEQAPVSMVLTSRHSTTSYYMASAKEKVGNKPTSHIVLHQAILAAKAQGQRRFEFGMLHVDARFREKLRNIAFYKRGYTPTQERRFLYWIDT